MKAQQCSSHFRKPPDFILLAKEVQEHIHSFVHGIQSRMTLGLYADIVNLSGRSAEFVYIFERTAGGHLYTEGFSPHLHKKKI